MRTAFTLLMLTSAAVLIEPSTAHAMPAPRAGTLVPPLVLASGVPAIDPNAPNACLGIDLPDPPACMDVAPASLQMSAPVRPDTRPSGIGGYIGITLGLMALGGALLFYDDGYQERVRATQRLREQQPTTFGEAINDIFVAEVSGTDSAVAALLLTEVALIPTLAGLYHILDANGVDWAYDHASGAESDEELRNRGHVRAAKAAGLSGLILMAVGTGGVLLVTQSGGDGEWKGMVGIPSLFIIETGFGLEIVGLVHLIRGEPSDSSDSGKVGVTLLPLNGGLGAGIGMKF